MGYGCVANSIIWVKIKHSGLVDTVNYYKVRTTGYGVDRHQVAKMEFVFDVCDIRTIIWRTLPLVPRHAEHIEYHWQTLDIKTVLRIQKLVRVR